METNLKEIYLEGSYLDKNPSWHAEDSFWKARNILSMIERNSLSPLSVCEVGCGSGEILVRLLSCFDKAQYFGFDISPQAFEVCQKKENENLKFFLADLTEQDDTYFDLLLVIDVFEHISDYLGFLSKIKNKGKYHIFHIPLDMSVSSVLRTSPIIKAREQVGHLHYFSKETALETLKDTGFNVIDVFYTCGAENIKEKSIKTRIANIPRMFLYSIDPDLAARLLGGYSLMVLTST